MERGVIFDIKHYALHDGPGIRTTVFLKGCPLSCWWCHNPESQSAAPRLLLHPERCIGCGRCQAACQAGAVVLPANCTSCGTCAKACPAEAREMVGSTMTLDEVMREIRKDIAFYDQSGGGVTFSGGEPLYQVEFLAALLDRCRSEEIHTVVDTSGFAPGKVLVDIAGRTELFLYDVKHMDSGRHETLTGVPNAQILDNLRMLADLGARVRVRVPIIPGINDDDANIAATGSFVASLAGVSEVDILPYHSAAGEKYRKMSLPYRLSDVKPPSDTHMQRIAVCLRSYGLTVKIGG